MLIYTTGPALKIQKLSMAVNMRAFSTKRLAWCQISAERQQVRGPVATVPGHGCSNMLGSRSCVHCLTSLQDGLGALPGWAFLSQSRTGNRQPTGRLSGYGAFP